MDYFLEQRVTDVQSGGQVAHHEIIQVRWDGECSLPDPPPPFPIYLAATRTPPHVSIHDLSQWSFEKSITYTRTAPCGN